MIALFGVVVDLGLSPLKARHEECATDLIS